MENKTDQTKFARVVDELLNLGYTKVGIAERLGVDPFMFQNAYRNKSQTAQDIIYPKLLNEFKDDLSKEKKIPLTMEVQVAELRNSMTAGFQSVEQTLNKIL